MTKSGAGYLLRVFGAVFFTVCLAQLAAGQNSKQSDDKDVLRALLTEVTLLRQTLQMLQGLGLDTYRSQLLVDRIRVSQEDVRHRASKTATKQRTIALSRPKLRRVPIPESIQQAFARQSTGAKNQSKQSPPPS